MFRIWIITLSLTLAVSLNYAQKAPLENRSDAAKKGTVSGIILDKDLNRPIEYANIALYASADSTLVTGGITDAEGKFTLQSIPWGNYYLTVKFIGYDTENFPGVNLSSDNHNLDIGKIYLSQSSIALEGVNVTADRAPVVYKIDKKVVNPEQFPAAAGRTAIEVLEQTPSVTVDAEGTVSLRGSTNFTVLIDGRPSPLDGSDALQQIPTSSID